MPDSKPHRHSGVSKLGISDIAAGAALIAGSLGLCTLMHLLAG